jgi:choline-sulfatase
MVPHVEGLPFQQGEKHLNLETGGGFGNEPAKQPNILFVIADQLSGLLLKIHDPESVIKTPNIDKLAANGVVFENAYCNSPLCAPSRFCMITGQLPSKIGAYDNASPLSPDIPTFAHYLRKEGYETTLAGKVSMISLSG